MINVYFESTSHADLVAQFDNEETYMACVEVLDRLDYENHMIVTESVTEETLA